MFLKSCCAATFLADPYAVPAKQRPACHGRRSIDSFRGKVIPDRNFKAQAFVRGFHGIGLCMGL